MKVNAIFFPKNIFNLRVGDLKEKVSRTLVYSGLSIGIGLILGTLLFNLKGSSFSGDIYNYLIKFTTDYSTKTFPEIYSGLIIINAPYFILMFILGATPFGKLPSSILTSVKCVSISYLISYMYGSFGLKGIEYSIMIIFPGKIILLLAILLLTDSSIVSSDAIKNSLNCETTERINLNKYYIRNIIIALIFAFSALVDSITAMSFSKLFSFSLL